MDNQADGAPFTATVPHPEPAPRLETCEVIGERLLQGFFGSRYHFVADALGPTGRYVAAKSKLQFDLMDGVLMRKEDATDLEDPATRGGKAALALDDLVTRLVADGWEPAEGRGPYWYSLRFRRQARVTAALPTAPAVTSVPPPAHRGRRKSVGLAYVLWLLLGLLGGHRYYLDRTGSALLQTLTLGGLGLWWLADAFLLPGMVRRANTDR